MKSVSLENKMENDNDDILAEIKYVTKNERNLLLPFAYLCNMKRLQYKIRSTARSYLLLLHIALTLTPTFPAHKLAV